MNIIVVAWQLKLHRKAIEYGFEAISKFPSDPVAHHNLGIVLDESGKHDDAESEFLQALRLDPKRAASVASLGLIELQRGRMEAALAHFEHAVELQPLSFRNWHWLGLGRVFTGDAQGARDAFFEARALTNSSPLNRHEADHWRMLLHESSPSKRLLISVEDQLSKYMKVQHLVWAYQLAMTPDEIYEVEVAMWNHEVDGVVIDWQGNELEQSRRRLMKWLADKTGGSHEASAIAEHYPKRVMVLQRTDLSFYTRRPVTLIDTRDFISGEPQIVGVRGID